MKRLLYSAAVLALVSIPAFAAKNQQTVSFSEAVTVGSTQLPAGDYKVTWTGTGSNVQVTLVQKDAHAAPTVITATAVEGQNGPTGFTVERVGSVNQLQAIQAGKTSLVFASSPAQGQ